MATLTFNNLSFQNITTTEAGFTGRLLFTYQSAGENNIRETLKSISLISSVGTLSTPIEEGSFRWVVSKLPAGSKSSIKFQVTYSRQQYQTATQTIYFFYYREPDAASSTPDLFEFTDRLEAAEQYYLLKTNDYELWPNKSMYDNDEIIEPYVTPTYNGEKTYIYYRTENKSGWVSLTDGVLQSDTYTLYTRPNAFYFNNTGPCTKTTWEVSKGITSVLPGLKNFNTVASQWRRWKDQSTFAGTCTAIGGSGNLSATMLNNAYGYLGRATNYQTGDKIVLSMFTGLENILNG